MLILIIRRLRTEDAPVLRRGYSTVYIINILTTSIFTLLFDVGFFVLLAWLLTSKLGAPEWLYVPAVLLGLVIGITSMLKFILASMKTLERLDGEREDKEEK
ncbi:MAG: hypothetical protein IJW48_02605 [Clostridia bacterium]|nr:hypothetical protein [Clostridia bacterium]